MLALITGTALHDVIPDPTAEHYVSTPFGPPSAPIQEIELGKRKVLVIARHGLNGSTGAHLVNYRANVWALRELQVSAIIATATVGGISPDLALGDLVVPDQVIDYTYGREQSYAGFAKLNHFDFTYPFTAEVREVLLETIEEKFNREQNLRGVYGCTQGPRLETAAEIEKFRRDGCDLIGMTLMPEAALARELDLSYAAICMIVNPAAGIDDQTIDFDEVKEITHASMLSLREHLERAFERLE